MTQAFGLAAWLFPDSDPEAKHQSLRRSLPLTGSDGNATLLSPTVVLFAVPIIFTVGIKCQAFPAGSVEGDGRVEIQYEFVNVQ